jgi:hypothetical protein
MKRIHISPFSVFPPVLIELSSIGVTLVDLACVEYEEPVGE